MIQPSSSKIVEDEVEGIDDVPDKTLSQREYCFIIEEDPRTLSEAMASRDVAFWKEAVQSEIDSIMHNDTWELTDLPPGCKALGCFRQKEGIDFFDTYAPVARISTIRLLLALAAIHDLVIHQMDVKTAFLNGDLDEEIYMKQPEGFVGCPEHESIFFYYEVSTLIMEHRVSARIYLERLDVLCIARLALGPNIAFVVDKVCRKQYMYYRAQPIEYEFVACAAVVLKARVAEEFGLWKFIL
ncbi:zinc finger, CCHC-type containing protein [Tanacetum coccineum]